MWQDTEKQHGTLFFIEIYRYSTDLVRWCSVHVWYYFHITTTYPVNKEGKSSSIVRTMESHCMLSMYRFCHRGHAGFEAEVRRFLVRKLLKE